MFRSVHKTQSPCAAHTLILGTNYSFLCTLDEAIRFPIAIWRSAHRQRSSYKDMPDRLVPESSQWTILIFCSTWKVTTQLALSALDRPWPFAFRLLHQAHFPRKGGTWRPWSFLCTPQPRTEAIQQRLHIGVRLRSIARRQIRWHTLPVNARDDGVKYCRVNKLLLFTMFMIWYLSYSRY